MSSALIKGVLNSKITRPQNFYVSEKCQQRVALLEEWGITRHTGQTEKDCDLTEMLEFSDVILLCVQPQQIETVLRGISGKLQPKHLVVSIAAGITLEYLQ